MVKLHILSDLHLEFSDFDLPETDADIIVLAGDIGLGTKGLEWASQQTDKPILYVAGNHEYYNREYHSTLQNMRDTAQNLDIYFLENDEIVLNDTRFLGCTLWTDFAIYPDMTPQKAMVHAGYSLSDFRLIHNGRAKFTPEDSLVLHKQSIDWLEGKLKFGTQGQKCCVITHHAPHKKALHPRYGLNWLSTCFVSNLPQLMGKEKASHWIFGHTHACMDFDIDGTRVLSNTRGYDDHETIEGFDPELVIEV